MTKEYADRILHLMASGYLNKEQCQELWQIHEQVLKRPAMGTVDCPNCVHHVVAKLKEMAQIFNKQNNE